MSVKMKFGSKDIPFVYKGDKLIYPNPIKDGLLLWYDFKGMRNTDTNKEVAKDLSGNGNDGTLTNFNFTEGSGYKDNTLVFDGVDDKLVIPELELDETAMSVMHDDKIYSYEDDKVMTVDEDGEIVGSGRNLLPSFYDDAWYKRHNISAISPYHLRSAKGGSQAVLATIILDVKPNTDYTIFVNTDLGRTRISSDSSTIMGYQSGDFSRVFNTGTNESVEVELGVFSGNVGEEINFSNVMLCQGRLTQRSFTPAPEDFQTTSLSPLSLSNLQVYNRSLRKNELLHNAESKGLKELVDGVIVQDGLVLHYDFSHESNASEYKDKAFDYSGNGNHGELQNFNFTEESGYEGNKLKFDGVDDRVVLNTELPTVCTYEATFVRTSGFSWKPPMSSLQISSARETGFAMTPVANGIVVSAGNGVDRYKHLYFYTDPIPENELTHLVTSYDGASFSVYLNGIFLGTQPYDLVQNNYLNLGNWSRYTGSGYWYNWETHSAKIYNRALTQEEITHNYEIEKDKYNIE